MPTTWEAIDLSGDPRFVAGWRSGGKRLDAHRFKLHNEVFPTLRDLCTPALDFAKEAQGRPFEPFAGLEEGEQYSVQDISALPPRPPTKQSPAAESGTSEQDTADLVRLIRVGDALDEATREDMDERRYSFYAICWPMQSTMIGFVSKSSPIATLQPGVRYFQYGETLKTAERPDLALREGADLIVAVDEIAIIRPFAFTTLLGDVGVSFQSVPDDVKKIRDALSSSIPLSSSACDVLTAKAQHLSSLARRLRLLPQRLEALGKLDTKKVRASMKRHGVDPGELLNTNGQFTFPPEGVEVFLDVIEGRYFEDDLGDESRRADRYSRRK